MVVSIIFRVFGVVEIRLMISGLVNFGCKCLVLVIFSWVVRLAVFLFGLSWFCVVSVRVLVLRCK